MYHNIHSSVNGPLGYFCILATANSAAVFPQGVCPVVVLLHHMVIYS